MRLKGRKSIELAVNFLVVFILSVVVFGFGIWFAYNVYDKGKDAVGVVDDYTQDQLDRLLIDNRFAIVPTTAKVYGGDRVIFNMGLKNALESSPPYDTPEDSFLVHVEFVKAIDKDQNEILTVVRPNILLVYAGSPEIPEKIIRPVTVKKNNQAYFKIGIRMKGMPPGTYIFDVTATTTGMEYWKGKLYLEVV